MNSHKNLSQAANLIKDIKIAMLTTVDQEGRMSSRPMMTEKIDPLAFEGKLWFFTGKDSLKVSCIQNDQHVSLTYSAPKEQHYVSISGLGKIVNDPDMIKKLWHTDLDIWFPKGASDPNVGLICVEVDSVHSWDSPMNKLLQIYQNAHHLITGKPLERSGHTQTIDLGHHH
jgi:general stress protein 26